MERRVLTRRTAVGGPRPTAPRSFNDAAESQKAMRAGIDAPPLSRYDNGRAQSGLVLGYAGLTPDAIRRGVRVLAKVI